MPKATNDTNTTAARRPVPAADDTELLRLHAALVAQGEVVDRIAAEPAMCDGITPESEAKEAKMAAEDDVWRELAEKIVGIPAQTSAGLHVKAEVSLLLLQSYVCVSTEDTIEDIADGNVGEIEDRKALSIARDILARSAAA